LKERGQSARSTGEVGIASGSLYRATLYRICVASHSRQSARHDNLPMEITFQALCHLASWERQLPIAGGWAFEAAMRRINLLDYSVRSLNGIDKFLDQVRLQKRPSTKEALQNSGYGNLMELLAFYVGEVIARANQSPVRWSLDEVEVPIDPFTPLAEQPRAERRLTCWVYRGNGNPAAFWPTYALMSRLLESGDEKSIRFSAEMMMATPADENSPLAPLTPLSPGIPTQAKVAELPTEEFDALRIDIPFYDLDSMRRLIDAEDDLLRRGRVIWGMPVQVNTILFEQRWHGGAPGELIYDLSGRAPTEDMYRVARALMQLKLADPAPSAAQTDEERGFAEYLRDGRVRVFGRTVPPGICSYPLQVSSTYFDQLHLPDGSLSMDIIPILVHDDHPGVVKPLPCALWPQSMVDDWMNQSQRRFGRRATAQQLRDEVKPELTIEQRHGEAASLHAANGRNGQDRERARLLWETNVGFGYAPSMRALGDLHASGEGLDVNPRQAFQYYLAAAQAGDAKAQVIVAKHHLQFDGIAPDLIKAEAWLRKADRQGNRLASRLLIENGFDEDPNKLAAKGGLLRKLFGKR
jgi:hypothetical protein